MNTLRRIAAVFAVNTISLVALLVFAFMATHDWVFPNRTDWVQAFCAAGMAAAFCIAMTEAAMWALNMWTRNEREAVAKREALDAVLALRATAELACCVPSADAHDGWMAGVGAYTELIEAEIAQQEGFSR